MEPTVSGATSRLNQHVVQAGAGAGKTRSLIDKVVSVFRHFRETEGRAPRMIVTTFTRKATQELRERLIVRACEERDAELLDYVGNARALQISTIHGVLNLFLSQIGHLCGLEAGFRVISDGEEQRLGRTALKKTLLTLEENLPWMEDYAFENLLELLLRFSEAYAQDPNLRPASLNDLEAARAKSVAEWRGKMTAIADEILGQQAEDEKWSAYAAELKRFAELWDGTSASVEHRPDKPRKSNKSKLPADFQDEIGDSIADLVAAIEKFDAEIEFWPYFVEKWETFFELGVRFHREFWNSKLSEGLLSASDLETFSIQKLRELPVLGGYFAEGWDFWLIDEFQDTSRVQEELLQRLRGHAPAFIVGDPQQSIYLFRGAKSEVFVKVIESARKSADATVEELTVNYRSEPALLEFLNDFFSGYSPQFRPMRPRPTPAHERRLAVSFISAPTVEEENLGILAHVSRLLDAGARFDEICVLARTHAHLAEVAAILKEHKVPVQVHSPDGFWRRRETLDAIALLKFLVHPHDNQNVLALVRSPFFRVPDGQLVELTRSRPKSLWIELAKNQEDPVVRLRQLLEMRRSDGLVAAFEKGLLDCGLLDLAFQYDPSGRREANLWKLIDRVRSEEKKPGFQALTLVEEVEEWLGGGELMDRGDAITAQEPNCVRLMTIHGSKGLEFAHVILPRMGVGPNLTKTETFLHHAEESIFTFRVYLETRGKTAASPLDRVYLSEQRWRELAEQDRSLYVAMTRAKSSLALCWSDDQLERDSWAQRGRLAGAERFGRSAKYGIEVLRPPFSFAFAISHQTPAEKPRELWQAVKPTSDSTARQTVTQMIRAQQADLTIEQLRRRQLAANHGLSLHRAFQSLKVKPDLVWAKSAYPELASALQYVWDLKSPPCREIILNGEAEWGFKIKSKAGVIQGRIDLWGRDSGGNIWILDYKSGRAQDEAYWEQLRLYARALRYFGHSSPIQLALIHPLHQSVSIQAFVD